MSQGKRSGKGLDGPPSHHENAGFSARSKLLVIIYDNMTSVDIVRETNADVLPP